MRERDSEKEPRQLEHSRLLTAVMGVVGNRHRTSTKISLTAIIKG